MENTKIAGKFYFKIILILLLVLQVSFISACVSTLDKAAAKVDNWQQRLFKTTRKPGERQVHSVEDTYETYRCLKSKIIFESVEVIPKKVPRGSEINQRMRFAFCSTPKDNYKVIEGNIIRKVFKNNREQFADVTRYTFRPGTWIIDAFLEIPPDAEYGNYTMKVTLDYNDKLHTKNDFFEISL